MTMMIPPAPGVRSSYGVDVGLLRAVLEFLTSNRRSYNQETWLYRSNGAVDVNTVDVEPTDDDTVLTFACNTTGCLAGWVALAVGFVPHWVDWWSHSETDVVTAGSRVTPWLTRFLEGLPESLRGGPWSVAAAAQDALGLRDGHAQALFAGENTLRDLWEYAAVLSDGAIEVPIELRSRPTSVDDHKVQLTFYRSVYR